MYLINRAINLRIIKINLIDKSEVFPQDFVNNFLLSTKACMILYNLVVRGLVRFCVRPNIKRSIIVTKAMNTTKKRGGQKVNVYLDV